MNIEELRKSEAALYVREYQNPDYKMGEQRKQDIKRLLTKYPADRKEHRSFLDIGTGRGETLPMAWDAGYLPYGTEIVPELIEASKETVYSIIYAEAHKIPYRDKFFQVVTCFDVMEHLIEEDLIPAVQEMVRLARKMVIVSCSEIPSSQFGGGRDLHISARPAAQWKALIEKAAPGWTVTRDGEAGGSPVFVVTPNE